MLSVIILAVSKEVYDEIKYGGFDWKDIVATTYNTNAALYSKYSFVRLFSRKFKG